MILLFYTYSYTSYNPKPLKKNKLKRYLVVFLGDWSAKGQELYLCEHCGFFLMSLKLISKDKVDLLHTSSLLKFFILIKRNLHDEHAHYQS